VGGDVPVYSKTLLVTDFVNLKIKSAQYFRCVHRGIVCVRVFIKVSAHMCINIFVYTVFLKKNREFNRNARNTDFSFDSFFYPDSCKTRQDRSINPIQIATP
jgi:hypothetical protein